VETTPGTVVSLAATDVRVRIRNGDLPECVVEPVETQEIQDTSSSRPVMTGRREFRAGASWIVRPHTTPLTQIPVWARLVEAGMLKVSSLKSIAITSVVGTFTDGETITGGTSAATGLVFRNQNLEAGKLSYVPVTGALVSGETITGGTSAATATTSGTPQDNGQKIQPVDSSFGGSETLHHLTVEFLRDGVFWRGRGCLGEFSMEFRANQHAIARSRLLGAYDTHGDKVLFSGTDVYPQGTNAPPRFVAAALKLGSYSPTDIVDFTLNFPLNLELREDANDAGGILYADYDRRATPPLVNFEPALVKIATFDFYSAYKDGSTFAMTWKLGSNFDFFADECQFVNLGVGSRRELATVPLQVRLCGKTNNELQIWCH